MAVVSGVDEEDFEEEGEGEASEGLEEGATVVAAASDTRMDHHLMERLLDHDPEEATAAEVTAVAAATTIAAEAHETLTMSHFRHEGTTETATATAAIAEVAVTAEEEATTAGRSVHTKAVGTTSQGRDEGTNRVRIHK